MASSISSSSGIAAGDAVSSDCVEMGDAFESAAAATAGVGGVVAMTTFGLVGVMAARVHEKSDRDGAAGRLRIHRAGRRRNLPRRSAQTRPPLRVRRETALRHRCEMASFPSNAPARTGLGYSPKMKKVSVLPICDECCRQCVVKIFPKRDVCSLQRLVTVRPSPLGARYSIHALVWNVSETGAVGEEVRQRLCSTTHLHDKPKPGLLQLIIYAVTASPPNRHALPCCALQACTAQYRSDTGLRWGEDTQ